MTVSPNMATPFTLETTWKTCLLISQMASSHSRRIGSRFGGLILETMRSQDYPRFQ